MQNRLMLFVHKLRTRLWIKPLGYCILAVISVFLAKTADLLDPVHGLPDIDRDTIETLLSIISSSMLPVAIFAAGSMVAAYSSASSNATPRAFELILTDDLSKTALSSFIGAFIFSVVGVIALKTGLYGQQGRFVLLVVALATIAWVVATFVRWVDNIARLGKMPNTIDLAESATHDCLKHRRKHPFMGGRDAADAPKVDGTPIFSSKIGYVQLVEVQRLQEVARDADLQIVVEAQPGLFITPDKPLMRLIGGEPAENEQRESLHKAFVIDDARTFDSDPRFGMIVLSEIAQRALSPGVNDPGTAIIIIGRMVRLLAYWLEPNEEEEDEDDVCDRVFVPALALTDLFDDAFTGIARDGASNAQLGVRLIKAFVALSRLGSGEARAVAKQHARMALAHAEAAIDVEADIARLRDTARPLIGAGA